MIFNLTRLYSWGRTLAKYPHVIPYADDVYITVKMSVSLQVLTDLKDVPKEDTGLDLNVSNLHPSKGISQWFVLCDHRESLTCETIDLGKHRLVRHRLCFPTIKLAL